MKTALLIIVLIFSAVSFNMADSTAEVYFNAGVEKYLQGDYSNAIDNLEKSTEADPENNATKQFLLKVFIEAATQYSLEHKYSEAMSYLEKAKKAFPADPKIDELYRITKGVLNSYSPEKYRVYGEEQEKTETAPKKTIKDTRKEEELKSLDEELEILKKKTREEMELKKAAIVENKPEIMHQGETIIFPKKETVPDNPAVTQKAEKEGKTIPSDTEKRPGESLPG